MRDPAAYLEEIELALVSSPVVAAYEVLRAWANSDDGYVRPRATLVNGDFLEAAEYFVVSESQPVTIDYRHQWMDGTKQKYCVVAGIAHLITPSWRISPIIYT